jgi:polyisoprenoid-binding protein YceI
MDALKTVIAFVTLIFISFTGTAQTKKIDYKKSAIAFTIKNAGLKVDGRFDSYTVALAFDPQNLSLTRIEAELNAISINTGINGRDNHLKKQEFFNVAKFPQVLFTLTSLKKLNTGDYMLYGKLTIKDVTKEVSMPMKVNVNNNIETYESNLKINRLDYHVGEDSWVMSNDVLITIKIVTQ